MKFLTLAAMVLFSTAASAGTVESANPTTSQIKINGVTFEQRVHDNGLQTSGNLGSGLMKFESIRVLVLEYQALDEVKSMPASMRIDLFTEVRTKCQELGDTELANQSKNVAKNFVVRGGVELSSSLVDNPPTSGRFVCRVRVTADQTSK